MVADGILIAVALAFTVMGVGALAAPTLVTRQFGIPELTSAGRSEVRAVYGGFGVAIAGMLIYAVAQPELRPGIVVTVAVALFGMAVGRLISAAVDRSMSRVAVMYFTVEVVAGALLGIAR